MFLLQRKFASITESTCVQNKRNIKQLLNMHTIGILITNVSLKLLNVRENTLQHVNKPLQVLH